MMPLKLVEHVQWSFYQGLIYILLLNSIYFRVFLLIVSTDAIFIVGYFHMLKTMLSQIHRRER